MEWTRETSEWKSCATERDNFMQIMQIIRFLEYNIPSPARKGTECMPRYLEATLQ